ncbi:MAG: phospholipase D family protein [Actinomycetota bacterium]
MLDPQDRILFTEALRPPDDHELSWAIGTTFTLDLVAAVAAPLAFALFDWKDDSSDHRADAIPLLEALRRYADRMTVFVQAGQIAVPKPQQFLLSYLDESIVEAVAPQRGGLFHPKVWLLRFEDAEGGIRYRFLCQSRNLTFDRAWDSAVVLEGPLIDRKNAFSVNRPLSDFVAALPSMATGSLHAEARQRIRQAEREVLRVEWDLPEGFAEHTFWPMGVEDHRKHPISGRRDRSLVVAPFVGDAALSGLMEDGADNVLISKVESLQELKPETIELFPEIYVLDEAADIDARAAEETVDVVNDALTGLHAKIYVADAGWHARIWTGSTNATDAGFGPNVEFLVELRGPKSRFGIEALLSPGSGEARFRDLLKRYETHEYRPPDEVEEGLRVTIEEVRAALARAELIARVGGEQESGLFTVAVIRGRRRLKLPEGAAVRCWPVMHGEGSAVGVEPGPAGPLATFEMAGEELTGFFAFSVEASAGGRKREERFTLNLTLEGAPEDRRERVLRTVLKDRDRVLRFLLFLLAAGDAQQAAALLTSVQSDGKADGAALSLDLPLFESMLRALERQPSKLDHVARVVDDLRKTTDGESLIPDGFLEVWEPIWAARQALR